MPSKEIIANEGFNEILLYTTPNGKVKMEVFLRNETIWLTQQRIADLFGVDRSVITKHLRNIYSEDELQKEATCAIIAQVQTEGKRQVTRNIEFYNLDAIISVGYRVNSQQATHFRIWATERLREYIIKGFTMDDERLKNPQNLFGKDYFDEQLARIRDIRSSERRFYQKITDIYAQCSADYNVEGQHLHQSVDDPFLKDSGSELVVWRSVNLVSCRPGFSGRVGGPVSGNVLLRRKHTVSPTMYHFPLKWPNCLLPGKLSTQKPFCNVLSVTMSKGSTPLFCKKPSQSCLINKNKL